MPYLHAMDLSSLLPSRFLSKKVDSYTTHRISLNLMEFLPELLSFNNISSIYICFVAINRKF